MKRVVDSTQSLCSQSSVCSLHGHFCFSPLFAQDRWLALLTLCSHRNFHVDPLEPNRVWWLSRAQGTHMGTLPLGPGIPPTNKFVQWPVQASSMLFNENKQCYQLSVGYVCDRRVSFEIFAGHNFCSTWMDLCDWKDWCSFDSCCFGWRVSDLEGHACAD